MYKPFSAGPMLFQVNLDGLADGGTIFLDEIGELPIDMQAKLLRVIQDGEFERLGSSRTIKVNIRILAATNRNLAEEVRTGGFREDLWYRLNIFPITVPPLRDRLSDIPMLADFFIRKICKRMGRAVPQVSKAIIDVLQEYPWPGNIRELENVLERAVINSSGTRLQLADELCKKTPEDSCAMETLEAVERRHILYVLEKTGWKVSGKNSASEILGLNRSTLRARMTRLNIVKPQTSSGRLPPYRLFYPRIAYFRTHSSRAPDRSAVGASGGCRLPLSFNVPISAVP